tara:strand:+ start:771 stop:1352 length:582 start_codon:yes stop_codon:yes gene_type:complete
MAFFLGQDVSISCTTENPNSGVSVNQSGTLSFPAANGTFAGEFGGTAAVWTDREPVTSVDVSIGAVDEDISYFGMRSQTKAEIKKETTITITRKKNSPEWDVVFNEARYGTSGTTAWDGLEQPSSGHGYRLFLTINPGNNQTNEVMTFMGCCVQSHTVTVNTDGTMDETLELMTYITPVYEDDEYTTEIGTNL